MSNHKQLDQTESKESVKKDLKFQHKKEAMNLLLDKYKAFKMLNLTSHKIIMNYLWSKYVLVNVILACQIPKLKISIFVLHKDLTLSYTKKMQIRIKSIDID